MPTLPPLFVISVSALLTEHEAVRTRAMETAAAQLDVPARDAPRSLAVAGCSWRDIARTTYGVADDTLLDLLHLAADAEHARLLRDQPPALEMASVVRTRGLAERGWRVVLRSDATRRAAGSLLALLQEETLAWRIVAADDVRDDRMRRLQAVQYALMSPWRAAASSAWREEMAVIAEEGRSARPDESPWCEGWPPLGA